MTPVLGTGMDLTGMVVAGAFLVAAYMKGTTAMGFPLIATPMVALVVDIRTAYALLLAPNILMDVVQVARGELPWRVWRRLTPLLLAVVPGVFLGTRILFAVPERVIFVALAGVILAFLGSRHLTVRFRVPPRWEGWIGAITGFIGGLTNGVTNVLGPLMAIHLLALEMPKQDFVKAMASIILAAKVAQLAAVSRWGIYTAEILSWSVLLTAVALAAFWVGLKTQDRVRQETFRAILNVLLFGMAVFFIYRGFAG